MLKVAIVGKPNVGKSTLFNRLIKNRIAIVDDVPGITRDRIFGDVEWLTKRFQIIDTGGLTTDSDEFQKAIEQQVQFAIDEADVILFVCSYKEGINSDDHYAAKLLKKHKNKKILFVLNKIENQNKNDLNLSNYFSLGFGKPMIISAEHAIGIGDLLDEIIKLKEQFETKKDDEFAATFCIIGKPNVGKSSLLNQLLKKERVLVSDVAGTTRDAIDATFKYNKELYKVIDTAGIRRKGKIATRIEKFSVQRTQQAISRSQFILLMLDGSQDLSEQDEVIGGLCMEANLPTIIVVNKWDIVKKDEKTMNLYKKQIRNKFKYLVWSPIIFISAKENLRIDTIFETIKLIKQQLNIKISTSLLNDVISKAQMMNQAPIFNGNRLSITYTTQAKGQIPTFVLFCNNPDYLHFSYARFLENKIREAFGLTYVPMTLYFKSKNARNRKLSKDVKFKQVGYDIE
ncbi:ribosome biogenesis GTPase Der [Mycoplasma sp. E35C]|uniref:ribosome biogenesis GTPase Der n=1 Tax=Mycoplasma sp. E35C TaxID=2801918 RepID=UPI001CA38A14|nr:ribosome biogenesis GTPase Der [Mycoplasma sp. E35C]QZX49273.1 ribosome biogenesis GTPase Der [Mycoplasma sp. E35C]